MGNLPLHPLVVHVPLVLAMLLPAVVAAILIGDRRGRLGRTSWWTAAATAGLLFVGSLISLNTGGHEEERVEAIVAESAIERHEERAETFTWAGAAALALLCSIPLFRSLKTRKRLGAAGLVAAMVVGVLAIRVGHSGGSLVYVHNAGAAYVTDAAAGDGMRAAVPSHVERSESEDDDAEDD